MNDPNYNPPSFYGPNALKLPSQYRFIKVLGSGTYGEVVKCWNKDMNQPVAVKIPLYRDDDGKEIPMMQKLMRLKLDQHNIIKFLDWFNTRCGKAQVFEMCDICLQDYIVKTDCAPMRLSDISTIIQQLATALAALKRVGVIHNDLKLDNIMMVNHKIRPFKVKLIDFGLALQRSEAKQGMNLLTINRSPEIMLDLPFSEAIDMWSLGYVMTTMILGDYLLFDGNEYEAMHYIVEILGQPPDHLLNDGLKTENYFIRTESNSWRFKTLQEYWGEDSQRPYSPSQYSSLDDLRHLRLEKNNKKEAVERGQCIDLLEAMFKMDQAERITPSEVLSHPFIDKGHQNVPKKKNVSRPKMTTRKTTTRKTTTRKTTTRKRKVTTIVNRDLSPATPELPSSSVMVPLTAGTGILMMDTDLEISEEPSATAAPKRDDTTSIHQEHDSAASLTILPSGVILVQPAEPENTLSMEDEESAETALRKDDTTSIHLEHHSPASLPVLPSGVILVQPAEPENTLMMEDEESAETALRKDDTTSIHLEHHSPASLNVLPSGVILVQPAAPENTLSMEDEDSAETVLRKDATTSMSCDDTGTQQEKKKKKKKNCVWRFFSWMRKTE